MGLKITEMENFEEHDKYMSLIQGMTHFSHVCFTTAMKKLDLDIDKVMEIESDLFSQSQQTDAHKEFLLSFREKRKPNYHNNFH